jgi:cystathionine beta-lyase
MTTFDDIAVEDLRRLGGLKWSLFPDKLGAFVAEMDFGTAPPVVEALHAAVGTGAFGYLPAATAAGMSVAYADWARREYGWRVAPDDVRPVADVVRALEVTIESYSRPGSAVILPVPAYMPFLEVPVALGREVIRVPMVASGDRLGYDLDALDAAFRAGGDLLVLCNPHNPIGRVLEREEMLAVAAVVDRHGGRVFSDEIHAPLVFGGHRHVPYASIDDMTSGHTVTATSASKAWNLPGLKCAQVVLSNDGDRARWAAGIGAMAEHGASTLGVIANTAAYSAGRPWLEDVLRYLDGNRLALADLVAEHLPGVRYTPPEGTYLAWLDCRDLGLDEPAAFFREHAGVAMTDGALCGAPGFVRYTLATPRPIMVRALEQMRTALARR